MLVNLLSIPIIESMSILFYKFTVSCIAYFEFLSVRKRSALLRRRCPLNLWPPRVALSHPSSFFLFGPPTFQDEI
jgi:hypothetical protein